MYRYRYINENDVPVLFYLVDNTFEEPRTLGTVCEMLEAQAELVENSPETLG